jgi:hypothetical protein
MAAKVGHDERRAHRRKTALWAAKLKTERETFPCVVLNVSKGGVMLQVAANVAAHQRVSLEIERFGTLAAEVVWQMKDTNKVGLRFIDSPEQVARILGDTLGP